MKRIFNQFRHHRRTPPVVAPIEPTFHDKFCELCKKCGVDLDVTSNKTLHSLSMQVATFDAFENRATLDGYLVFLDTFESEINTLEKQKMLDPKLKAIFDKLTEPNGFNEMLTRKVSAPRL